MRVFSNGRITIPQSIREQLGISPGSDVEFRFEKGRYYLHNRSSGDGMNASNKPVASSKKTAKAK